MGLTESWIGTMSVEYYIPTTLGVVERFVENIDRDLYQPTAKLYFTFRCWQNNRSSDIMQL